MNVLLLHRYAQSAKSLNVVRGLTFAIAGFQVDDGYFEYFLNVVSPFDKTKSRLGIIQALSVRL